MTVDDLLEEWGKPFGGLRKFSGKSISMPISINRRPEVIDERDPFGGKGFRRAFDEACAAMLGTALYEDGPAIRSSNPPGFWSDDRFSDDDEEE